MTQQGVIQLGVVGAGNMGSGIAQKMAAEGFRVVLVDVDDARAQKGHDSIRKTLAQGVERGVFKPDQADRILGRITASGDWRTLAGCDLIVEAVFENFDIKKQVFARLEEICPATTILGTNTSSFSVTDLQATAKHPGRILGLHYFYHPAMNRLVEVVPGKQTDPSVTARAWALQEQLGKTPITSADAYGFIVNRFFLQWLNEAIRMIEEGFTNIATIDAAAMQGFSVSMGPFKLMNVSGIPIAMHTGNTLAATFGPFCAPPALLVKQVESGQLWDLSGAVDESKFGAVVDRMMGATFLPAAQLVDEGVGTLDDIDIGARVGLRWKEGPFGHMNKMGPARAKEVIGAVAKRWQLPIPKIIEQHASSNTPFPFCFVRSEIKNGIATLTFNRPDTLNAVNEEVVRQMRVAFDAAVRNDAVKGIVLAGAGKAFVAGADIHVFVRNIETGKIPDTIAFTRRGHELLHAIDTSPKPVVARLHGLALGGGFEIALACDYIVAADKASMAFPETGIGIYPGLGGTQRTSRRVGVGLAKFLVLTGQMVSAADAAEMGLVDRAVPQAQLDAAVAEFLAKGPVAARTPKAPPAKYRAVADRFEHASADDLRQADPAAEADEPCRKAIGKLASKGPIALRLAGKLIEQGAQVPLEQGLALELEFLSQIFATHDAYVGLKSIGGAAPVFEDR